MQKALNHCKSLELNFFFQNKIESLVMYMYAKLNQMPYLILTTLIAIDKSN